MKKYIFLLFLFSGGLLQAQFTINNPSPQTTDQIVNNILVGVGVSPTNIKFNGSTANALLVNDQAGFWNTNLNQTTTGFDPLQTGLVLTTGKVSVALGPNNLPNAEVQTSTPFVGDVDLAKLSGKSINNVAVLEFDFVATGLELNFDFVFGSEEYIEYVNSTFNDAFGFFLSGPGISGVYSNGAKNIALIPGTNTGVSIDNVNHIANSAYYVDNTGGTDLQYDGYTKVMRASSTLECGGTYHIKLVVGNAGSNEYDSGVLIKNFEIPPMELVDNYGLTDNPTVCYGETITISSGITYPNAVFQWTKDGAITPGNGPDLQITSGGVYGLKVYTPAPGNCMFASDEITIGYLPKLPVNDPVDIAFCSPIPPPYSFDIDQTASMLGTQSASDYYITYYDSSAQDARDGATTGVIPNQDFGKYKVYGTSKTIWVRFEEVNGNGCVEVKPFELSVNPYPTISGDLTVCKGLQTQLTGLGTPYTSSAWTSSDTAVATVDNNGLVSGLSLGTADISYTNANGCNATVKITVIDLPTATISGTTDICSGSQTAITFNGTPNATVTYKVDGGSNQTIKLDATGTNTVTTPNLLVSSTYTLVSVATSGTSACSQLQTGTATISILALPTATISGTTTVCQNDIVPLITFTGANGIAPYTFTYKINNGTDQTITTTSGNSVTVNAPTTAAGSFVYELVSVSSSTTPACSQSQTGSATVTVNAGSNATISYNSGTFCITETSAQPVNFTGTLGGYYAATPAGLNLDATTGAIIPSASSPGTYSVTYHVNPSGGCPAYTSNPTTVNILVGPTATISYGGPYCASLSGDVAVIQTGTTGGIYTASPNGLTINATTGTITPSSSTPGNFTVSYTIAATGGCQELVKTATVTINAEPNATISYNGGTFCITEATAQPVSFSGTTGGYYTATPAGLNLNTTTGAILPSSSTPGKYAVTYHVNPSGGCQAYTSNPTAVEILAGSTATIAYAGPYCVSLSGDVAVAQTGATGGIYSASPNGLTINSNTGAITPSSSTPGSYTVSYKVASTGGCPELIKTANVVILDKPNPTIDSGNLCVDALNMVLPGSTVILDSGLSATDHTFEWYNSANVLVGTQSTLQTNVAGNYSLIAQTKGTATCATTVNMTVGTVEQAVNAMATVSNYFEDSKITVEVDGNGTYLYELDHSGIFQESNVFNNVSGGTHTVTIQDTFGCTNITLTNIMVINYPRFFTPNGDGFNDTWNITALKDQPFSEIYIFDRYGKLIKRLRPSGQGWDGTHNGYPLAATDFWFTVKFMENGVEKLFKSHFSLKR